MVDTLTTSFTLNNHHLCQTKQCLKISEDILNKIDFNINPCDDFYQYSCGSWLEKTHLNSDQKNEVSHFSLVNKQHEKTISTLLQHISTYEDLIEKVNDKTMLPTTESERKLDKRLFNTMKHYFNACMNTTLLTELGATPLYSSLVTLLKKQDERLVLSILYQLVDKEFPLFYIDTIPDNQQPHRNAIWIDKPTPLFLKMNHTSRYQLEQNLYHFTLSVLSSSSYTKGDTTYKLLLGLSKDQIRKKVNHTILFDSLLSQIYHNSSESNIVSYNYATFSTEFAIKKKNIIDWMELINKLIGPNTSPSLLASTNIYIDESLFQYRKSFSSSSSPPSRLNHCVSLTSMELDSLVGRYFILYTQWNENKRKIILSFLNQIKVNWKKRLIQQQQNYHEKHHHQIQWLDDLTMTFLMEKLNKMKLETVYDIIYPDIRSPTSLYYFYHTNVDNNNNKTMDLYQISPFHFFQNNLILHQLHYARTWFYLYKININGTIFPSTLVDNQDFIPLFYSNAYYLPNYNKIILPAGLITSPFFYFDDDNEEVLSSSSPVPTYINMGSLGMILAHELTHAFDVNGRLYDSDGKKENGWSKDVMDRYLDKIQCFIDQYSNMTVYDEVNNKTLFINGKLTLNENLADNGGLSVAYDTLKMSQASSSSSFLLLPNINLSPDQLFFVRFSQSFCSKLSSETLVQQVHQNSHPPSQIRVNTVIQNSEVFASHFHCPTGSPMNPIKKCKMW
ncbi:unnamed protein product [Cunninghamella blakesleeana]